MARQAQGSATVKTSPAGVQISPKTNFASKTSEGSACLSKAKLHLTNARNLKTEIKNGVIEAIDRLYQLVKELEVELQGRGGKEGKVQRQNHGELVTRMEEHTRKLKENNTTMEELKEVIKVQMEIIEKAIYASIAANTITSCSPKAQLLEATACIR